MITTLKEAYAVVGKPTTDNSKMTKTLCFNTDPEQCNTGSKLRKMDNTPCRFCYSLRLCNFRTNVHESYVRNTKLLISALQDIGYKMVAQIMAFIIKKKQKTMGIYKVRIKDGGDAVNILEFLMWMMVAMLCRDQKFWFPTKEYGWLRDAFRQVDSIPSNIIFRVSTPVINQPHMKEFRYCSVVYTQDKYDSFIDTDSIKKCIAKYQGNACLECDYCYDPKIYTVVYPPNKIKESKFQ